MKKYTLFSVCCLVSLIAATTACAQGQFGPGGGFTGPGYYPAPPAPPGGPGASPPSGWQGTQGQYGFTGSAQTVTVRQAQSSGHGTPVIIRGKIVQAIGGDMFQFRDSSGEIVLRIGAREWQYYGTTISPQDTIEISGEVCYGNGWEPVHIHARFIRKI